MGSYTCECDPSTACCDALADQPIDEARVALLAAGYRALGDPYRVAIVQLLAVATGPVCVVDIERHLPLAQSTVSYHLKYLIDAGVLERERRGRWSYYTVVAGRVAELAGALARYSQPVG